LTIEHNNPVSGPYRIEKQGHYQRLTIDGRYHILLDFHSSNYARLLLLDDDPGPAPFAPFGKTPDENYNPDEKKLFRLGDIR
jgi:hypothetical protein